MQVFSQIVKLRAHLDPLRRAGKNIGFVPTMGALHAGHISLVERCKNENDVVVASIYVNPTQFNNQKDLQTYPRNTEKDLQMLEEAGCDVVFTPTDDEMYPEPDNREFDFGHMGSVMEGKYRPGHFNGVGQIVTKLFDAVVPNSAYFGQKDFQQLAIIRKLVKDLNYAVEIIACPIVREKDGLAMSSRNMKLNPTQRKEAPLIYKTLREVKEQLSSHTVISLKDFVRQRINANPELKLEYFELVDTFSLAPVSEISSKIPMTACIAVFAEEIRLIDNVDLNS